MGISRGGAHARTPHERFAVGLLVPLVIALLGSNAAMAEAPVSIGHHSVAYLGTVTTDGVSTARWAVTENGCGSGATSSRKGTGCNGMSHIAFEDFVGSITRLRLKSGPYVDGTKFWTITDIPECQTLACLGTDYGQFYGASRPDGPGSWIKFSTVNGETVALATGKTHVFAVLFSCTFTEGSAVVAIKSGTVVARGSVPAPRCS